ncbi:MAG: hypothetical protein AB7W47_14365 [Calditrichaceae bacterium]
MSEGQKQLKIFRENIDAVDRLANFDRVVLDYSIKAIEDLQNKLKRNFTNESLLATRTLKDLNNIRVHDSMRTQYQEIFNQCVVLLVSHFGSTITELFKYYVTSNIDVLKNQKAFSEEFKLSPMEMSEFNFNLRDHIGEIIISKKNISFQDMQSINRSFKDFLNIDIVRDEINNDIIMGQACRHVIVHSGSNPDKKMLRQIASAVPRNLKPKIRESSKIQFDSKEIARLATSMKMYVENLVNQLDETY